MQFVLPYHLCHAFNSAHKLFLEWYTICHPGYLTLNTLSSDSLQMTWNNKPVGQYCDALV